MPIDKDNPLRDPFWERQKHETELAFGAFRIYRDLPYGAEDPILTDRDDNPVILEPEPHRTHGRVAELLDRSRGHISNWASDWQWTKRAEAYDKRMERLELEERNRARREAARKMEERAILYREDAAELYTELLDKVRRMLAFPVAEEKIVEDAETGEQRTVLVPAKWNMNTLARLVSSIEDLARFAAGTDDAGMMDRLLERIDPASLTHDQRRRIINGESIPEVIFGGGGIPVPNEGVGTGTRTNENQISEVI